MSALQRLGIVADEQKVNLPYSEAQNQTKNAFGFKWSKRDTYESDVCKSTAKQWLFKRYCDDIPACLSGWLDGGSKIILDAGCGSGYSALLFFGDHLKKHDYLGIDISDAIEIAKVRFREAGYKGDFLNASIFDLDYIADGTIDIIFAEGVLHHTDSVERSVKYLTKKLKSSGRFLFYVYAKKAPIREFTDDFIRREIAPLSDEQAWEALEPLTRLGMELGKLDINLDIPDDIPYLGIKKGIIDLQRFFYWNICKCFYRPDFSLEEMNHINFDWFRPLNCHRHTPDEICRWCSEAGLVIERMSVEDSGITVVGLKGD
ncbi:MAG: class I SAM-dependent methyltransferase [Nitrospirota bacterium]